MTSARAAGATFLSTRVTQTPHLPISYCHLHIVTYVHWRLE